MIGAANARLHMNEPGADAKAIAAFNLPMPVSEPNAMCRSLDEFAQMDAWAGDAEFSNDFHLFFYPP